MNAKITFGGILVTALAATPLFAGEMNEWKGTAGDWSTPGHWKLGHAPTNTEDAILYATTAGTTNVVQLSEDMTNALARIRMRPQIGKGVVLDGNGYTFCPPDLASTETVYETTPLIFGNPHNYDAANGVYSGNMTGCRYTGAYRLVNPRIEMTEDADKTVHTLFTRGAYNFWNPNGTELSDSIFRIGASSDGVTCWHMRFSDTDTSATFARLELMNMAKKNVLEFAGGNYSVAGSFFSNGKTYDMATGSGAVHTVRVTDCATLTIAGETRLYLNQERADSSGDAKYSWNFEVLNGATLNTTNTFFTYRSTNGVMRLENATWNAPGNGKGSNLAIGIGYAGDDYFHSTRQKMIVVNSKINVGEKHDYGNFYLGRTSGASRSKGSLYATNSTFNVKSWFSVRNGEGVLKDCTWTGNATINYSMSVENDSVLTLEGGTYSGIYPRMNFDSYSKTGPTLNIRGATITYAGNTWNLGFSDSMANCAQTCTVHMTSGSLSERWINLSQGAQPAHFILEGGTYSVKQTYGGAGSHAKQPTKGGWAHFTANGGLVLCPVQETYTYKRPLFNDIDRLDVGPNGLVLDTNGKSNHFMVQDVTDMDGESGRFVKRGAEQLRLVIPSKWDVSETVIENGSLLVDTNGVSTAVTMATAMTVGPGAKLSIVGNTTALTVDSLAITNATLALDAGDVITVKGAFAPDLMKINFSSALTEDVPVNLFVFEQPLSVRAVSALKLALVTSALPAETVSMMTVATDSQTGRTIVSVTARKAPVVSADTVWHGTDAAWSKAANWSADVPAATNRALVVDGTASKTITVDDSREVGALALADDGFVLNGAGLIEFAAYGNSRVDVAEGSHEIAVGTLTHETIPVDVAPDATLAVTGAGEGRGFVKEGKGRMVLDGEGRFSDGVLKAHGGRLVVSNAAAFAGATLTLGNGTLEIPESVTIEDGGRLAVVATNVANDAYAKTTGNAAGAVVVDNAGDATFTGFDITSGCLVKRGKGTLTLDLSDGKTAKIAVANGDYAAGGGVFNHTGSWAFDEDGTPPTIGYAGLSVMGGELVVKGDGKTAVKSDGAIVVGTHTTTDCGAQPVLTLDNLKLSFSPGYYEVIVGNRAGCKGYFAKTPVLRILNGSMVTMGNDLKLSSDYTSDYTPEAHPVIAITNSTVVVKNLGYGDPSIYFSTLRGRSGGVASLLTENARMEAKNFAACGMTDSRITGSTLTGVGGIYTKLGSDKYRKGRVLFDGGTVLKVDTLEIAVYDATYTKMMTWAFDDATWDFGDGDFAITSANCYLPLNRFEMVGTGLRIAPAAGKTFSTDAVFMGEGSLVKSGAGTLRFNAGTYQFTGPLCALAGTVDLSQAGTITNACFGAGDGVISGATVVDPVFRLDAGAPNLATCTLTGIASFDVGEEPLTKPYPTNLTVLKFTGTPPNVSRWRLTGAGKKGLGGTFTVQDGEVKVTIEERGLAVIVR